MRNFFTSNKEESSMNRPTLVKAPTGNDVFGHEIYLKSVLPNDMIRALHCHRMAGGGTLRGSWCIRYDRAEGAFKQNHTFWVRTKASTDHNTYAMMDD